MATSLLSTIGHERGMLEDYYVGIRELSTTRIRVAEVPNAGDAGAGANAGVAFEGTPDRLVAVVYVPAAVFAKLTPRLREVGRQAGAVESPWRKVPTDKARSSRPLSCGPARAQGGGLITVRPVLFSQGINEQQTYANAIGESSVQDWINWESLLLLRAYCQDFKAFLSTAAPGKASAAKADLVDGAVNSLAASIVSARRNKNTDVLTLGEKAARLYGCARGARRAPRSPGC